MEIITQEPDGSHTQETIYKLRNTEGKVYPFDAIIIAADLKTVSLPTPAREPPYMTTHVTLVEGDLKPSYFGVKVCHRRYTVLKLT